MDFKKNISKRVLIFLIALVASAAGPSAVAAEKTRCAFLWGNVEAGSGSIPFVIDGVDWFYPATARDQNEPGPPGYCPSIQTTRHQAGPFVVYGEDAIKPWDFVTDFYEVTYSGGPRQKDGSCHTGRWGFDIDAKGNGEGNGIVCGTYVNLPTVSIEPLQVKVDKRGYLRVKMMRKGAPYSGWAKLVLQAQPGSGRLDLDCAQGVGFNAEGIGRCGYTAPDKPIVETVVATAYDEETRGTITVVPRSIVVGFFNGVWNTEEQAGSGLDALTELVGPAHGDARLRYEKFYNQTGRSNGNTWAQDISETFIQRSNELDGVLTNRWEHYWELLSGRARMQGSLTDRLLGGLREGASALSDLIDSMVSSMLAGFVKGLAQMMSNPPTAVDVAAHLARLQALADEGNEFVLVAHSQGNLFVNLAYDGLKSRHTEVKAAVVHVAPASPTVRGKHVIADIDIVINGLRNFGSWSVQDVNLWFTGRGSDASGHTLVGTYLDGARNATTRVKGEPETTPRAQVKGMIVNALDQVSAK